MIFTSIRTRIANAIAPAELKQSPEELERILRGINGGTVSQAGEPVTPETAMRVAAVQSCVRVLADDVGKLPLLLYKRTKNGGKERATDHPLYRVLRRRPNSFQTPITFYRMMVAHLELRGNAYALITRGTDGKVRELLPIHPDRVTVAQGEDWSLSYTVKVKKEAVPFPADRILHIVGLSLDGITGVSPITYARETIGLAIATEKHGARLFKNGARPGVIVKRPAGAAWSPEAAKRFIESFAEKYSGENAFRAMLLEDGMELDTPAMNNEDAQFLETRQYGRSEICGLFRVPPHKIADLTRSTNNNIEHQGLEYYGDGLMPRLVSVEQAVTAKLLTDTEQDEYFAEFLVDAILRADFKTRMEGYAVAIQNSILSPNEARSKENMNPREGGDAYLRPANMLLADAPNPPAKEAAS